MNLRPEDHHTLQRLVHEGPLRLGENASVALLTLRYITAARLAGAGFATIKAGELTLTPAGRAFALRDAA